MAKTYRSSRLRYFASNKNSPENRRQHFRIKDKMRLNVFYIRGFWKMRSFLKYVKSHHLSISGKNCCCCYLVCLSLTDWLSCPRSFPGQFSNRRSNQSALRTNPCKGRPLLSFEGNNRYAN